MNTDVVLINPKISGLGGEKEATSMNVEPPLGLVTLGTYLKQNGFNVKIIDALVDDVDTHVKKINHPLFVGFSVMTSQIKSAIDISKVVKFRNPDTPIVWGGMHPTLFPEQTLKDPLIDFVTTREGEETSVKLAEAIGDGRSYEKILGLGYKKNDIVKINLLRSFFDINKLAFLDWSLVCMKKYINTEIDGKLYKTMYIHSSRGCPHRCSFCINTIINKCQWRSMPAQRVLEEIEHLHHKYKINNIWFREENFFGSKSRSRDICEGLVSRDLGLTWFTTCRADYFNSKYLNDMYVKLLKESGCIRLSIGSESGSQRMLDYIRKDEKTEDNINCARACEKHGIAPVFSFMTGLPTETKKDTMDTIRLIKDIKKVAPSSTIIGPQVFRPYPGSSLYDWCLKHGLKEPDTLRGWTDVKALSETGFISTDELPWISNPAFTSLIGLEIPYALNMSFRDALQTGSPMRYALYGLGKVRLKTHFWGLPVEKWGFDALYKIKSKMRKR